MTTLNIEEKGSACCPRSQTKTIGHVTIQHTLTIFTEPNMTYPKSWGNRPQRSKTLKIDHFSFKFEHSSVPIKIKKQNKSNWPFNCMWNSYQSMHLRYKPLLNLPPNVWEKELNGWKDLELTIILNFEQSPLPISIQKVNWSN